MKNIRKNDSLAFLSAYHYEREGRWRGGGYIQFREGESGEWLGVRGFYREREKKKSYEERSQ